MGNLLVPNSNYCAFEDWIMPVLDAMKREQDDEGARWTPSKVTCDLVAGTSGALTAVLLPEDGLFVWFLSISPCNAPPLQGTSSRHCCKAERSQTL